MRIHTAFVLGALLVAAAQAIADDAPARYADAANGFSLKPPQFAPANTFGTGGAPVLFRGPGKAGAEPACTVSISNSGMTLVTYRVGTLRYFKAQGITLQSEEPRTVSDRPATVWRYGGENIQALALMVYDRSRLLLVTCVAPPAEFAAMEPIFRATIDSFEVNSTSKP
jgi:hypothetical protein